MMDDFDLPTLGGDDEANLYGSDDCELLRSEANGRFVPCDSPRVETGRRNGNNGRYTGPVDEASIGPAEQRDRGDSFGDGDLFGDESPGDALGEIKDDFERLGDLR